MRIITHAISICALCVMALSVSAQTQQPPQGVQGAVNSKPDQPKAAVEALPFTAKSEVFVVSPPTFNRKVDNAGRGEILEVQFEVVNETDVPRDFYVFVIATTEETKWIMNSFNTRRTAPEKVDITWFAPQPDNQGNFEYDVNGSKVIKKFPKDYKLGVDPATGKAYHLKNKFTVRTEHLTKYRKKFAFFNNATILVYDDTGELLFRQGYFFNGYRH